MLVNTLSRPEQALLFAAFLTDDHGAPALAYVHGESGKRCRQAAEEVSSWPSAERRRLLTALSRRLFGALPLHLERAHPSWIAEKLQAEPSSLASLIAETLPPELVASPQTARTGAPPPQLRAMLSRFVLGGLPELPGEAPPSTTLSSLDELATWSPARLQALLRRLGVLVLASWLIRAPELRSSLLSRLLPDDASALQEELGREPPTLASWPGLPPWQDRLAGSQPLPRLGAELLGSGLSPAQRPPIALLLPRSLGQIVLDPASGLASDIVLDLVRRASAACDREVQLR